MPITTAAMLMGTLTTNSQGQGAMASTVLAMVGPAAAETAMMTALIPIP